MVIRSDIFFPSFSASGGHEDGRDLGKVRLNGPWAASGIQKFFLVAPQCPEDAGFWQETFMLNFKQTVRLKSLKFSITITKYPKFALGQPEVEQGVRTL